MVSLVAVESGVISLSSWVGPPGIPPTRDRPLRPALPCSCRTPVGDL